MAKPVPVIDIFAGPGGLGEGFSGFQDRAGRPAFQIALSIEKEASAHRTLELRAFYRQFPLGEAPPLYYDYLAGKLGPDPRAGLFQQPRFSYQATAARREARQLTLGKDQRKIYAEIGEALDRSQSRDWILIGGPPCQAYSLVGRSRNRGISGYRLEKDDRSTLYREYLKIIQRYEPSAFVMENVKGLLSAKHDGHSIFDRICDDLRFPGKALRRRTTATYEIFSLAVGSRYEEYSRTGLAPSDYVIRSEQYGVPQARHRVILLGIRTDILGSKSPGNLKPERAPSVRDVIGDLPPLRSGLSKGPDSPEAWARAIQEGFTDLIDRLEEPHLTKVVQHMRRAVQALGQHARIRGSNWAMPTSHPMSDELKQDLRDWYRDPSGWMGVCNHWSRGHMAADLCRYLFCACYSEAAATDQRRSPTAAEFPEVLAPAHANWTTGHFADRFRVQSADIPATTVTSHISKDGHYFIHYDPAQCRSLTVREAARIQTFPDNYFFVGSRTQQYVQVGNAVPPWLARQIAELVAGALG
jgi:DNA (cytosine-5)-methyltransferase 1